MCRNVQSTLGINLRPSLVKALTHRNFRTAPQTKNLPILQDFVPYRGRCPKTIFSSQLLKKSILLSIFFLLWSDRRSADLSVNFFALKTIFHLPFLFFPFFSSLFLFFLFFFSPNFFFSFNYSEASSRCGAPPRRRARGRGPTGP